MKYLKSFNESKFIFVNGVQPSYAELSCSNPECDNTSISDDDSKCPVCGEDIVKKESNTDDRDDLIETINYLAKKIQGLMMEGDDRKVYQYYEYFRYLKDKLRQMDSHGVYRDPNDFRRYDPYGDW
jgi:hypothetical protein